MDRPVWVLEQASSSLDFLEMAGMWEGIGLGGRQWAAVRSGGPAEGMDWGDTGRRSGQTEWGRFT